MTRVLRTLLVFVMVSLMMGTTYLVAQTPAPAPATELTPAQKVGQLEAVVIQLQSQLAQKDTIISQLLAENAAMRNEGVKTQTATLTRRLILEAKGDPDKDTWDFNTMMLKKGNATAPVAPAQPPPQK